MVAGQKYLRKLGRWLKPFFEGAVLTDLQKRIVYQYISIIRSAVDIVALRCGEMNVNFEGEKKELFEKVFLRQNSLGETFRDIVVSCVVDLLTIGRGYILVAFNRVGQPSSLFSIDAVQTEEVYDQEKFIGLKVNQTEVPAEEVICFKTFASISGGGKSFIDCIANEAACYLRLVERVAHFLDKKAIPPGILNVSGGSEEAISALRAAFAQAGIKVAQDVQVDFKSLGPVVPVDPRVVADFESAVFRVFGVYFEQGRPTSWLVNIVVEDFERRFNLFFEKYLKGRIILSVPLFVSMKDLALLVRGGVLSPNEARTHFRLPPVKGGEVPSILAPTGIVTLPEALAKVDEEIEKELEKEE